MGCRRRDSITPLKSTAVESPELVAARIERALELVPPERLVINPDCGLRNLPTATASAKLRAMVEGAATVRARLDGATTLPVTHRPAG